MHVRQFIRETAVAALASGTSYNVFDGRIFSVYDDILPCVNVTTRSETIDTDLRETGATTRICVLAVTSYIKSEDSLDADLDAMSVEIEKALYSDQTLHAFCLQLNSTEIDTSKEGEQELAICTLSYNIIYQTKNGDPESMS